MIESIIVATLIGCYDGDTCTLRAEIWPDVTVETGVRIAGVDTPEIRGKCPEEKHLAREARDRLVGLLEAGKTITLHNLEHGKYAGRVVATLKIDGVDVADILIAQNLGRAYDGSARESWCEKE